MGRPVEYALAALIGVMHQLCGLAPSPQRHHQGINDQLRRHARTHGPAYRTTRVQIQHHRHIQPALSRPDVGEVSHPALIGLGSLELPVQNIGRDAVFRTLTAVSG